MKNNTHIIDSHCHLDFSDFDHDRNEVLENSANKGITDIVIPGVQANSWQALIDLCDQHQQKPKLHYAIGLHPLFMHNVKPGDLKQLDILLSTKSPVAVGEIGLDFYIKNSDHQQQTILFNQQLELASHYDLPVILHVRKAHDQVLVSLRKHRIKSGIVHAFNGSIQQAGHYLDLGFKLGFGGMLTYERSSKLRRLSQQLPLEGIVLETDAPDMTVASHWGQRNSPEYLPQVLKVLTELRQEPMSMVAQQSRKNTRDALQLT